MCLPFIFKHFIWQGGNTPGSPLQLRFAARLHDSGGARVRKMAFHGLSTMKPKLRTNHNSYTRTDV